MKKWIPWLIFAVFAAEIVAILLPKQDKGLHYQDSGACRCC